MKRTITILLLLSTLSGLSQYRKVPIPGSEIRTLRSAIVKNQEYELHILLPGDYNQSDKKYPVVYVMDSQWDFPLVKSIYGQQYYDGFIPELIIVGVTWGGDHPNPDSLRVRDYTPTNDGRQVQGGGADQFLSFMREELFPFIESNYRALPGNRTLLGCSLGGLLTLYTLFTQPDLFTGYAAASPAIGWDHEVIYRFEKKYFDSQTSRRGRLFLTIGDVESGVPGFDKFSALLKRRKYASLEVEPRVLVNTGHSGTKSETYSRGLQFIFQRNKLVLSSTLLDRYSGTYELPDGGQIQLKREGNGLIWYFSASNSIPLLADTDTHLYATYQFFNLYFKTGAGAVQGFEWVRYGNRQFVKKIN